MEAFWIGLVFGVALGAGLTAVSIFGIYKVERREWWEEQEREMAAAHSCMEKAMIEKAQLRVALAAVEITEGGKKVVAMTMAALEPSLGTRKAA